MEALAVAGQVDEEWEKPAITCGEAHDEVGDAQDLDGIQQPGQLLPQAEDGSPPEHVPAAGDGVPVDVPPHVYDLPRQQHGGGGEGKLQFESQVPTLSGDQMRI